MIVSTDRHDSRNRSGIVAVSILRNFALDLGVRIDHDCDILTRLLPALPPD
ncbi:unnamed protein product [Tuwongella immobilis]|uniref:Uncharacterized protein n=1 Tax=Tuwongella immobilis TaxID=692036 RepID=A0A6C2YI75_9BACT|nr:unnamed protein product [Tuwongella immobilis]VTR97104.1 unnamed protein product [Tuwongella immobilis]